MTTEPIRAVERQLLETRDVEIGHTLLRQLYADHVPHLSGDPRCYRFRYELNTLEHLGIDRMQHSLLVKTKLEPYPLLSVVSVRRGRLDISSDGVAEQVGPGDLLLVNPQRPISVTMADLDVIPVRLDLEAVRASVADLTGVAANRVRFDTARPLGRGQARFWQATIQHLLRDVLSDEEITCQPLLRAEVFRQLVRALLLTFPNSALEAFGAGEAGRSGSPEPAVLRRAIEFVDDNAHRHIGVADIAEASRVGIRGLQLLFAKRDQTPLGYLRSVRMERAHRELQDADPTRGDTVSGVAARWGFTNPGRFAVEYRHRYGCSPRQTLRA